MNKFVINHEGHEGHEEKRVDLEKCARTIVDSGLKVHRAFGPGLLESVYENCLAYELTARGLRVARQVPLPVIYYGTTLEVGYRLDLLVENAIIIEVKAVDGLTGLHEAQIITNLKLSGCRIGFLMNFNTILVKQGLKRIVL